MQGPGGQNHPLDEGQGCRRGVCIPTGFIPGPCGEENCQVAQDVRSAILSLFASNSADQNPMDYYFLAQIEAKEFERHHNSPQRGNQEGSEATHYKW